jgi:LacI family transcriptional regulator
MAEQARDGQRSGAGDHRGSRQPVEVRIGQGGQDRRRRRTLRRDEAVVLALRFIQTHAFRDIVVKDILREVPISRRSLEIQFQHYLGRSPAEEIRRVRLDKGCELLARTDLSIGEIASACGFANANYFAKAFRRAKGSSPTAYRDAALRLREPLEGAEEAIAV